MEFPLRPLDLTHILLLINPKRVFGNEKRDLEWGLDEPSAGPEVQPSSYGSCVRVDDSPEALLGQWPTSSALRRGSLFSSRRVHLEINSFRRQGKQIKDVLCSDEP